MCHPLPGPRCSRHVADQIAAAEDVLAAVAGRLAARAVGGHDDAVRAELTEQAFRLRSRLSRLRDEWDSTAAGQRELDERLAALSGDLREGGLGQSAAGRARAEHRAAGGRLAAGIWRRDAALARLRASRNADTAPRSDLLCARCARDGDPADGRACPDCDTVLAGMPPAAAP